MQGVFSARRYLACSFFLRENRREEVVFSLDHALWRQGGRAVGLLHLQPFIQVVRKRLQHCLMPGLWTRASWQTYQPPSFFKKKGIPIRLPKPMFLPVTRYAFCWIMYARFNTSVETETSHLIYYIIFSFYLLTRSGAT